MSDVFATQFIFEPKVYLLSSQVICKESLSQFLTDQDVPDWTTDTEVPAEVAVEVGGRICYESYSKPRPGGNKAYISHILEVGHGSVTEHTHWSFIVTGISRSLSHEWVRQRHLSPSQLSQRYVDESACRFVVPFYLQDEVKEFLDKHPNGENCCSYKLGTPIGTGELWCHSVLYNKSCYHQLTEYLTTKTATLYPDLPRTEARKKARQAARSVLPAATETKLVMTGNARAWRHFIHLRASRHADDEIRGLAIAIYRLLLKESPNLFGDFREVMTGDVLEVVSDFTE